MPSHTSSLRGYAFTIHQRDHFRCVYCGADGAQSFETWLTLSWDHLLPKGHPQRNNPEYIVTACNFCNTADNRFFDYAEQRGLRFDILDRDFLVAQRLPYVLKTRQNYRQFWEENVARKE